jgi:hypothetical protein
MAEEFELMKRMNCRPYEGLAGAFIIWNATMYRVYAACKPRLAVASLEHGSRDCHANKSVMAVLVFWRNPDFFQ